MAASASAWRLRRGVVRILSDHAQLMLVLHAFEPLQRGRRDDVDAQQAVLLARDLHLPRRLDERRGLGAAAPAQRVVAAAIGDADGVSSSPRGALSAARLYGRGIAQKTLPPFGSSSKKGPPPEFYIPVNVAFVPGRCM